MYFSLIYLKADYTKYQKKSPIIFIEDDFELEILSKERSYNGCNLFFCQRFVEGF